MALTTTVRTVPAGVKLPDGYQALVAFAQNPGLNIFEREVKAPGIDGGEPIDTTTMFNEVMRTYAARALKTLAPMSITAGFATTVYNDLLALCNSEGAITVHFGDGSGLNFFGYLQKFEPTGMVEGGFPQATVTIVPTNADPITGVEVLPVWVAEAGT